MSMRTKRTLIIGLLLVTAVLLAACSTATTVVPTQGPAPANTPEAVPTCPAAPACPTAVPAEEGMQAPFEEAWAASPHNALDSEAFAHWNETEDKMVPASCAKCHSTSGYVDFLGGDGSEAGKTDQPVAIGETVTCNACHSEAASNLHSVTFLSGVTLDGLDSSARCMVCHQGQASKVQVDAQIEKFNAMDALDTPVAAMKDGDKDVKFGFINVHYYAAAVTLYGTEVKGGYEYDGMSYDAKNDHVENFDSCIGCHDSHTTEVKIETCTMCHEGVASTDDLKKIRMISSASDYDGDGDVTEGMADEIMGLQEVLYGALQSYAADVAGTAIAYDQAAYPYFFADKDGDGVGDTGEGGGVAYDAWTPRLLKAAYNYQVSVKDPGAYAHGNKYIVQLLHDSIADLNEALATPVDMTAMMRDDAGHFAGNTEAFRHWDAEGSVPGSCAKCHSATGMHQFLTEGANISNEPSNGLMCSSCHNEAEFPALYAFKDVTFPSGAKVSFGEGDPNNLCLQCHQGRESALSIDRATKDLPADTASPAIRFLNVHYFAAGATLFGTEVKGIYEYPGKEYSGRFMHVSGVDTCTSCHNAHELTVNTDSCAGCHNGAKPEDIRMKLTGDYDGDGAEEGLAGEVETMSEALYAGMQAYAKDVAGTGIVYDAHAYPYFFADADNDGKADVGEKGPTGYGSWTPRLLKAAYNYQYALKDPGAYVHNASYVLQALYDSLADLKSQVPAIDISTMQRAPVTAAPAQ